MTTTANVTPIRSNVSREAFAGSVLTGSVLTGSVLTGSVLTGSVLTGSAMAQSVQATQATQAAQMAQAAPARLRLTRRGRIVFGGLATVLVAAALAFGAMLAAPGAVANGEQSTQEFPYVLAQSGDTLWGIASYLDPAADTRDVVAEIVRLNQLNGSGLQAGDAIAVPLRFADNEMTFPASELDG